MLGDGGGERERRERGEEWEGKGARGGRGEEGGFSLGWWWLLPRKGAGRERKGEGRGEREGIGVLRWRCLQALILDVMD